MGDGTVKRPFANGKGWLLGGGEAGGGGGGGMGGVGGRKYQQAHQRAGESQTATGLKGCAAQYQKAFLTISPE